MPEFVRLHWLPLLILGLWSAGVAIVAVLAASGQSTPTLCLLARSTGLPCPTCGGTRAVMALGRADIAEALRLNPLVTVALMLGPFAAVLVASPRRRCSSAATAALIIVCVALNWTYLLIMRPVPRTHTPPRQLQHPQSPAPAADGRSASGVGGDWGEWRCVGPASTKIEFNPSRRTSSRST